MPKKSPPKFYKPPPEYLPGCAPEQALCYDFIIEAIEAGWRVYPEYPHSRFDMLLVAEEGCSTKGVEVGTQIGVQAKMSLNPELTGQLVRATRFTKWSGPDYVVALIPGAPRTPAEKNLEDIIFGLGHGLFYVYSYFESHAHHGNLRRKNLETTIHFGQKRKFSKRIELPELNVWVEPGVKSPTSLTDWRTKAVKRCMELEGIGDFTRKEFQALKPKMDMKLWITEEWVVKAGQRGREFLYKINPDSSNRPDRTDKVGRDVRAELERLHEARTRQEEGEQAEAREVGEGPLRES